ncbi:MAG: hypothetical protein FWH55_09640 [Oscillospiraceae bacterium]|nr:hypothetical protein [Oscillospiraceae bacterium]
MKKLVLLTLVLCLFITLGASVSFAAAANGISETILDQFLDPPTQAKGMFRYWIPDGTVQADVVEKQMWEIYNAGFGGVEIGHVPNGRYDALPENRWGTPMWQQGVINVLKAANKLPDDFKLQFTICSAWPAALSNIDPNSEASAQELQMTFMKITGAEITDLSLPATKTNLSATESFILKDTFVAATVARVSAVNGANLELDYDTMQDISNRVSTNGSKPAGVPDPADPYCLSLYGDAASMNISDWPASKQKLADTQYTYKADLTDLSYLDNYVASSGDSIQVGDWVLYGFYRRGTGQTMGLSGPWAFVSSLRFPTTATVIDVFGETGAKALTDYWDDFILNPELLGLMKAKPGLFFEDSLEQTTGTMNWNSEMSDEIRAQKGYDITKYLPFLFSAVGSNRMTSNKGNENDFVEDFMTAQAELYVKRMKHFKTWAGEFGWGLKTQSYTHTGYIDEGLAATVSTEAEGESLEFGSNLDRYRTVATGTLTAGNYIVSSETMASSGIYRTPWSSSVAAIQRDLAAGVNRVVIHGYSYPYTDALFIPDVTPAKLLRGNTWPGWTTFPTAGDNWGERTPGWQDFDIFSDYLARTQAVLQAGTAKFDLAVMTHAFSYTRPGQVNLPGARPAGESDSTDNSVYPVLLNRGFSYEVYSEGIFSHDNCTVSDGVFDRSGAKALIINNLDVLKQETADKILEFAKAGLPVVFAGQLPAKAWGTDSNQVLTDTLAEALALDNVTQVADMDGLMAWLSDNDITASTSYTQYNLRSQRRLDYDGSNYHFLYNHNSTAVTVDVALEGSGAPYLLDAVTGEVTPIPTYNLVNGKVVVPMVIGGKEAAIVAISDNSTAFGKSKAVWATSSEAELEYTDNGYMAKITTPGTYNAAFSNGYSKSVTITSTPEPINLTGANWNLSIEGWSADLANVLINPTATKKTTIDFGSVGLGMWRDLAATPAQLAELGVWASGANPAMLYVSGIGVYTTSFNLPANWDSSKAGYVLNLVHNNDMITGVTVNGQLLRRINQSSDKLDIGEYLKPGVNTLEIKLSTTLGNAVNFYHNQILGESNANDGSLYGGTRCALQNFGLTGVTLAPYVLEEIENCIMASIRADADAVGLGAPASYTVSLSDAKGAGVVTLSFTADSRYLDLNNATALNGFSILEPLAWEYVGAQLWKGTVKLYCPGFVQSNDPLDVLRISGAARDLLGNTTVTFTDISVTGDVFGLSGAKPSLIMTTEAATSIVTKTVFSKYDLNHDGKIDELDLAIVVYYYLANDLEADWEVVKFDIASAKDCDVALNGRVDLADMIEVIANYCDSY